MEQMDELKLGVILTILTSQYTIMLQGDKKVGNTYRLETLHLNLPEIKI